MSEDSLFQQQSENELVYSDDVSEEMSADSGQNRFGFVLVMDHIDKNIRPSYQRENKGTKSYCFTHSYAALNRINISSLSDSPPGAELSSKIIPPDKEDLAALLSELTILVSRYVAIFIHIRIQKLCYAMLLHVGTMAICISFINC